VIGTDTKGITGLEVSAERQVLGMLHVLDDA
jgi:hypothetical protein